MNDKVEKAWLKFVKELFFDGKQFGMVIMVDCNGAVSSFTASVPGSDREGILREIEKAFPSIHAEVLESMKLTKIVDLSNSKHDLH